MPAERAVDVRAAVGRDRIAGFGVLEMTEATSPQDRTKPMPIIDAAIRAGCAGRFTVPCPQADVPGACPSECIEQRVVMAAARIFCPKEPPAEWIEAMEKSAAIGRFEIRERIWRAQPLWQELWGEP